MVESKFVYLKQFFFLLSIIVGVLFISCRFSKVKERNGSPVYIALSIRLIGVCFIADVGEIVGLGCVCFVFCANVEGACMILVQAL